MKALFCGDASGNLGVALQAFEGPFAAQLMAACAIGRTVQGLMCSGKRAGRDLCMTKADLQEPGNDHNKAEDARRMLLFQLSHGLRYRVIQS